jgi:hypothetical protein
MLGKNVVERIELAVNSVQFMAFAVNETDLKGITGPSKQP